jgi:hypothetical protein
MLLSGHARRSRSAAATQRWMVSPRATFGIESAAAVRVCASYRTLPPDENDIEFGNVTRATRPISGLWQSPLGAECGVARAPGWRLFRGEGR